jgi:hypothetical protein
MNTWAGASRTMAEYPYPWNLALAALSLASGFAQVSAIQSASFGSGGGGSISGGGTPSLIASPGTPVTEVSTTTEEETEPEKTVNITLAGRGYSQDDVRELIEQINEEIGDGAELVTS